eukprot:8274374-Pyramimonas_sp.AAC.1
MGPRMMLSPGRFPWARSRVSSPRVLVQAQRGARRRPWAERANPLCKTHLGVARKMELYALDSATQSCWLPLVLSAGKWLCCWRAEGRAPLS